MDNQKKYAGNHGRKPKPDKMRHRYVFRLDDGDNARFLALFDESGKATKAEFIVSALFGREIKVIKLDKGTQDFYMRLTTFHSQAAPSPARMPPAAPLASPSAARGSPAPSTLRHQ